jgi:hypothetical protein
MHVHCLLQFPIKIAQRAFRFDTLLWALTFSRNRTSRRHTTRIAALRGIETDREEVMATEIIKMRWFRRKNKNEAETSAEESQDAFDLPESALESMINPIQAFDKRLDDLLRDPDMIEKTKALQDTRIQMIVGGEAILLSKTGVKPLELSLERSTQVDVFIRMSEEAAGQLAVTNSLAEFKQLYKQMVDAKGAASYISIKLHTPLDELRRKGYFSVELLRILIDA